MNTIPQEILDQIVDNIQGQYRDPSIQQYAQLSRAWKKSVERITFEDLCVRTDKLDAFAARFEGGNISRWPTLRYLRIEFLLPSPENTLGCCPVTRILDREADTAAFSAAVLKLFTILADLECRAIQNPLLKLHFYRTSRLFKIENPKGSDRYPCQPLDVGRDGRHKRREAMEARAASGQFELVGEDIIPCLQSVESFENFDHQWDHSQDLKATWFPKIFQKLPKVKTFLVRGWELYYHGRHKRIARRECFSNSMQGLITQELREIKLIIKHEPMTNESLPVHKLVEHGQWYQDPWYCMFNHFSSFSTLTVLQLLGGLVICPEFFTNIINQSDTPFPSLIELELEFAASTADGRWFFERDHEAIERFRCDPEWDYVFHELEENEEDQDDLVTDRDSWSDYFCDEWTDVFEDGPVRTHFIKRNMHRSLPTATTFLPFLLDASKAVARILKLKKFILKQGDNTHQPTGFDEYPMVSRVFELCYLRPGMSQIPQNPGRYSPVIIPGDTEYLGRTRLYWRVDEWKPWDEVAAAWEGIAGPDAKIVFLQEEKWEDLETGRTYTGIL